MKTILQKYILAIVAGAFTLSLATVSAQIQITGSVCTTSGGQSGSWNGTICIGNGATGPVGQQQNPQANNVDLSVVANLIKQIQNIVALLVPLAIGVAVVWFMYNIIAYFINGDDPAKKATGLKNAGYGLIAIFLMVSIWGIIYFLNSTTGISQGGQAQLPAVPTYNR